jgi:hypothetical protein
MLECKGCKAKADEIRYLRVQVQNLQDRFLAMVGKYQEYQMGKHTEMFTDMDEPNAPVQEDDDTWANQELDNAAAEIKRKGGTIVPDFAIPGES